jgi:hypothetical protein
MFYKGRKNIHSSLKPKKWDEEYRARNFLDVNNEFSCFILMNIVSVILE